MSFAPGSVIKAVAAYHQAGRVNLASSADAARDALVADWWAARQQGARAAMYALRRSDVDDLNRRARRHLHAAGRLGPDPIWVAGRELAVGDDIVCLRNDRRLDVRNGPTATITTIDRTTGAITITGDDTTRVPPGDYLAAGHVNHAYATSIHKSEGATVERAFLLGSDALYREAGYVGLSRAKHSTDLYLVESQTPATTTPALRPRSTPPSTWPAASKRPEPSNSPTTSSTPTVTSTSDWDCDQSDDTP